jgi:hypothetical protein
MLALPEQRKVLGIEVLLEEFEERFLVLVPAEPVLGMTDLEALEVKLSEQSKSSIAATS